MLKIGSYRSRFPRRLPEEVHVHKSPFQLRVWLNSVMPWLTFWKNSVQMMVASKVRLLNIFFPLWRMNWTLWLPVWESLMFLRKWYHIPMSHETDKHRLSSTCFTGELPEGRHLRVENKNFYFDIGQNNRGIYMRISEVTQTDIVSPYLSQLICFFL